nr:galactinol synthase 2-like [Malus domestica]
MSPAETNGSKRAYVTFLAGNGDYWEGVVGLAKGLRKAKSAYPLVVAVLLDVPEDHLQILQSQGCIVHAIEPVYPPENQTQFAMAYYVINYSKLRIWEFMEYEKMIYLDGHIQVFDNIDHLFDMPEGSFYAVMDCFCEKTWSASPQYKIGYTASSALRRYSGRPSHHHLTSMPDFLNMFFKDIYSPIPPIYNLVLAMLWRHPENVDLDKVKVVHYCAAGSKPWRYTGKEEHMEREDIKMLVKKWWDIYDDTSLHYKNDGRVVKAEEHVKLPPFNSALSGTDNDDQRSVPSAA